MTSNAVIPALATRPRLTDSGRRRLTSCPFADIEPMFLTFFTALRDAGVPVTLREYLTMLEALDEDSPTGRSRISTICRAPVS